MAKSKKNQFVGPLEIAFTKRGSKGADEVSFALDDLIKAAKALAKKDPETRRYRLMEGCEVTKRDLVRYSA